MCNHIFYAACNDTSYLGQLVPYSGCRDKISLVQGSSFNPAFCQFGFNVTQFPTVFRWSELPASVPSVKPPPSAERNMKVYVKNSPSRGGHSVYNPVNESWRDNSTYTTDDASLSGNNGVVLNNVEDEWTTIHKYKTTPCQHFLKVHPFPFLPALPCRSSTKLTPLISPEH